MKKNVPLEKQSKKEKARQARERRVTWEFSPVSRVKESKKIYQRKRPLREDDFPERPFEMTYVRNAFNL